MYNFITYLYRTHIGSVKRVLERVSLFLGGILVMKSTAFQKLILWIPKVLLY